MKTQTSQTFTNFRLNALVVATICAAAITFPIALSGQEPQLGVSASAKHPTFITFDPPGSTFTASSDINPAGEITGF